jgi:hypothetical protein
MMTKGSPGFREAVFGRLARGLVGLIIAITRVEADKSAG